MLDEIVPDNNCNELKINHTTRYEVVDIKDIAKYNELNHLLI